MSMTWACASRSFVSIRTISSTMVSIATRNAMADPTTPAPPMMQIFRALRRAAQGHREHRGAGADRTVSRPPAGAGRRGDTDSRARRPCPAAGAAVLIRDRRRDRVLLGAGDGRCCARHGGTWLSPEQRPRAGAPKRPQTRKPANRLNSARAAATLTERALRASATGADRRFKIPIRRDHDDELARVRAVGRAD